VSSLAAGVSHSCALLVDRTVRCWGATSAAGQTGDATTPRLTPAPIAGLPAVNAISGFGEHVCALLADSTVRCWGVNSAGQLGDGTKTDRSAPVPVAGLGGA
jgi:alpha-tubulin suppressor-like RCC1 family protein